MLEQMDTHTRIIKDSMPPSLNAEIPLSENALTVLRKRYLLRDADGEPIETPAQMFWRVARVVAEPDAEYGDDDGITARRFYDLLRSFRFMPNSPTFTGAGTPLGQLAACFVLPIRDDMGRDPAGIFSTLRVAALVQQTGGGNGFSFSRLRPKGAPVRTSRGVATGPVGFLRVYDKAFGEIAQGGCLLPDTLVFTDRGLLRLDEIIDTRQAGWQPHEVRVATDEGWRSSPHGFNRGVVPVVRVHTRQGLPLTGTPDHKVKVITPQGPAWRALKDLVPGDQIMVKLGQHKGKLRALRKPSVHHGNQIEPRLPSILDEEFAFFLGYLAGDGFVASADEDYRVGVTVAHDSYLMEDMPRLMERLWGVAVHAQSKPGDASTTLFVDNRAVKDFLRLNGLAKTDSYHVNVPRLVRSSPPEIVGAFLRGLFEADGVVSHGYPMLLTISSQLAHEVATLLIGLGCPVSVRQAPPTPGRWGTSDTYQVRIRSHVGLTAWQRRIGCDERSRFSRCVEWQPDLARESTYPLPCPEYWLEPILEQITLPQIDKRGRGMGRKWRSSEPALRRQLLRYLRHERALTRSAYQSLAEAYPVFAEKAVDPDDLWFIEVESVEPAGKALTLDLEVEGNHTYLAYGMVTHNSRRGANMAVLSVDHPDILDFIRCKSDEGDIVNFNISVGITDAFMRAVEADEEYDLVNPQDGAVWKRLRARQVFDEIVKYAHRNGEPGILFLDAANRSNPVPHLYQLEATNPCLTGDTWITTDEGPARIADVIGKPTKLLLNGTFHPTAGSGFFYTGDRHTIEIHTRRGFSIKVTPNHPLRVVTHQTRYVLESEWRQAKDLGVGDTLILGDNRQAAWEGRGSGPEGYLLGVLVGDGTITTGQDGTPRTVLSVWGDGPGPDAVRSEIEQAAFSLPHRSDFQGFVHVAERGEYRLTLRAVHDLASEYGLSTTFKGITPEIESAGSEFYHGFLRGLFDADGTVIGSQGKGVSVRLAQSDLPLLQAVQRMLHRLGIVSTIYQNRRKRGQTVLPDGRGGEKAYGVKAQHELVISCSNLAIFAERVGFANVAKLARLDTLLGTYRREMNRERFVDRIVSISANGTSPVYDAHVPGVHAFDASGFCVHNCGEQWLGDYENCCLGSVNLAQHATAEGTVDWPKLRETVEQATHFLDNAVDANKYVPAVPEIEEAAHRARRIGLGVMGLGDLMFRAGIRYGSPEGEEFAGQMVEFVRYHAMRTSIALARKRGPFPAIEGSIYDPQDLQWLPPAPLAPFACDFGRPALDWNGLRHEIQQFGIRNAAQTTVAPTGTIGTVSGCEAYGCEPAFALAYVRHFRDGEEEVALTYTSPLFVQALSRAGLDERAQQQIIDQVSVTGSCQDLIDVPEEIRRVFVVASDIDAEEHVRMQAAIQAFVDNSISKTINFSEDATPGDVARAYQLAWRLGCKGLTVYVTGSREKVVLETKKTRQAKGQADQHFESRKPRPVELHGTTYRTPTPLGAAYITVNENGDHNPFEIFANVGKAGSDTAAVAEAIGRLISLALRMPSPLSSRERLIEVIDQLAGIGGGRPMGFGPNRVRSLPDAIAQVLARHIAMVDAEQPPEQLPLPIPSQRADLCPDCGQAAFVAMEGCRKCVNCGYSEC